MDVHVVYGTAHVYGTYSTFPKALARAEILNRAGVYAEILTTTVNEDYDDDA